MNMNTQWSYLHCIFIYMFSSDWKRSLCVEMYKLSLHVPFLVYLCLSSRNLFIFSVRFSLSYFCFYVIDTFPFYVVHFILFWTARNPPPVCLGVPYVKELADVCVRLYDINATTSFLHACVKVEARMKTVLIAQYDLGCFNIGSRSMTFCKYYSDTGRICLLAGPWTYRR